MVRIDKLEPGAMVRLRFDYGEAEDAVFVGISGEGDERRARFVQAATGYDTARLFDWEAYRFGGRWCYGSSAGRFSVAEVLEGFGS